MLGKLGETELKLDSNVVKYIARIIFAIFIIWLIKTCVTAYNPAEKKYIRVSRDVYEKIQAESIRLYKEKGFVWESEKDMVDYLCEALKEKYDRNATCQVGVISDGKANIKFKNGATISGFEKPLIAYGSELVKDVIIDVDGPKGKNTMGVDRVPVRIYSSERMKGNVVPLNCQMDDFRDFGIEISKVCETGVNINFMGTNLPLGFDIIQVATDGTNVTKKLSRNVSYLRADCVAFGADLTGASDYCELKKYYWSTACYHDHYCLIEPASNK